MQQAPAEKKAGDGMNWFGVRLGVEGVLDTTKGISDLDGVGKYLNLKRPGQATTTATEPSKRRKLGFGEFENF